LHYAIAPWQYELLERLGIDKDRIQLADLSNPAGFRDLIVPSRLSRDQVIHPAAARYMRERLCPHADGTSPQIGKRLYLTRSGTAGRQLLNESEIIARLKAANFAVVDPGSMSLAQQIDLFADAEVIVSPGGGALTNLIFAPKDARVITLSAQDHLMVTYPSLAAAIGQRHWWCCGPSFPRNPNRFWIWTMFDYEIPLRDLDLCLEQAL
jgi:capsular polysaccharide biosynthesis protein